jgi:hypothetical protein
LLRTVTAYQQRPWVLLAAVFFFTLLFGFVTQAAGSLYLRWTADPITLTYRTTLSYTSAIIGDALLLPIVNLFIVSQLAVWRRRPHIAEITGALLGGGVLTIAVHLYQATHALLNWTMTQPYSWTPLGYVHAGFMFGELSLVLFFWGQVAQVAREQPRTIFSHRVAIVVLCSLFFLRLLLGDYGYFA